MADEEVKVYDTDVSNISASNKHAICFFCHRQFSKYTCPRCNAGYCSTSCYKSEKHMQCSEGFYQDCVVQEISSRSKDPKDIENVLRMLKTLEEQDQDLEESDETSLEERFADIDLNAADFDDIWDALTPDEREQFEASVKTGSLSHLIKEWIPWWQHRSNKADIQEIPEHVSSEHAKHNLKQTSRYPTVLQKIPALTGSANPLIKYSIVDVLYAYAYVMRLYNGDPEENLKQSVQTFYELASSLSKNLNFENLEGVVHNCLNVAMENKDIWNSQEFSYNILVDVCDLLSGCSAIDSVLSDVCRLLAKYKKTLKSNMGNENEDAKKMFLAKKKVEFFLSWRQSNSNTLCLMVAELKTIHFGLISSLKSHENEKKKIHGKLKGNVFSCKKLIEEL